MGDRRLWRHFDYWLLAAVLLLLVFGLAMVRSATLGTPDRERLVWDQMAVAIVGLILLFVVAIFDYRLLSNVQPVLYVVTLLLLTATLVIGVVKFGAQRWIALGSFTIQPSEFAKPLVVLILAKYLADREKHVGKLRTVLVSLLFIAPLIALVYRQPDLSTSIVLMVAWFTMIVAAGMRSFHIGLLGGSTLMALPFIWLNLASYQRDRVLLFLDPGRDEWAKYNIDQARIAIGSGGWIGKGYASGTQSQGHFLKVRHTDFIFSVIGEEMGLIGCVLLMVLVVVLVLRALRAASLARDTYGRLICVGVATVVGFQAFINIGMNLGVLPVTGVPLPFISYGRSAMLSLLPMMGLVESVVMRHRKLEF